MLSEEQDQDVWKNGAEKKMWAYKAESHSMLEVMA
jgi:hypothetical protein